MRELSEPAGPRNLLDNFAAVVDEARAIGLDVVVEFNDKTFNRDYVVKRASDGITLCTMRSSSITTLAAFVAGYAEAKAEPAASGVPTVVVIRGGVVQGVYGEPGTSIELVDLDNLDDTDRVVTVEVEDIALNCAIKGMVAEHVENQRALGLTN